MAKKKKETIDFRFNLTQVKVLDFSKNIPKKPPEEIGYAVNINHKYDKESENVTIGIVITAKKSEKAKTYYCKLKTDTTFTVLQNDDIEELPVEFVLEAISIAYSTARGILLAKNEDNFLLHHPLTLLNLEDVKKHLLKSEKKKD